MKNETVEPKEGLGEMTVSQALKAGIVMLKKDVDSAVSNELKKLEDKLGAKLRKKLEKEVRAAVEAEKQAQKDQDQRRLVGEYIEGSNLTDIEFGIRLMKMNVPKEYLKVLLDVHNKWNDIKIWDHIRANV